MKRALLIIISAIVLMSFTACGQSTTPVTPDQSVPQNLTRDTAYIPWDYCGESKEVDLIVGQSSGLGTVTVSNDSGYLYFDIALTDEAIGDGWVILETHADIWTDWDDAPVNKKGNPKVGNFDYTIESSVSLELWPVDTVLYVAVHAALQRIVDGEVVQEETGWGEGTEFGGGNWSMYFQYTVQGGCYKDPPLPPGGESIKYYINSASNTYINTYITDGLDDENEPGDWEVWNGTWPGWCVDKNHWIIIGEQHNGQLYSSFYQGDWPTLEDGSPDPRFDKDWYRINYVINHKVAGASMKAVQAAIWYFTDGIEPEDLPSNEIPSDINNAWAMINDAKDNGGHYLPGVDEKLLVLIYSPDITNYQGSDITQLIAIEIDP